MTSDEDTDLLPYILIIYFVFSIWYTKQPPVAFVFKTSPDLPERFLSNGDWAQLKKALISRVEQSQFVIEKLKKRIKHYFFIRGHHMSPHSSQHYGNSRVISGSQFFLPPDRGNFLVITPAEAGNRFIDLRGMKCWVALGLGSWYTNILLKDVDRWLVCHGWGSNMGILDCPSRSPVRGSISRRTSPPKVWGEQNGKQMIDFFRGTKHN